MAKRWHRWPSGLRQAILQRDRYQCQATFPHRCLKVATEVDHKVSPMNGGPWFDPANLRAVCRPANRVKGDKPDPYPEYPLAW